MTFKYFDRPDLFTEVIEDESTCDFCQKQKNCFTAELFFGDDEISAICPECLKGGKLFDTNLYTCSGDINELKRQIKALHPALTDQEIEQQAKEKTSELEKTTPHLVTWQDWCWPCADGDYCQFIGFGSEALFNRLTAGKSPKDFFEESIYYDLKDSDIEYLWADALPEKEVKNYEASTQFNTLFYVFKSLNSDKIITIWDCS